MFVTGILNAAVIWRAPNNYAATSFTWQCVYSGPDHADMATSWQVIMESIVGTLANVQWNQIGHDRTRFRWYQGGDGIDGDDDGSLIAGTRADVLPYYACPLVRKYTGDPARYRSGRAYIPYCWPGAVSGSRVDNTDPDLAAAAALWAGTYTDGGCSLTGCTFNRATGEFATLVGADISPFLAFQRRRNIGKHYYDDLPPFP